MKHITDYYIGLHKEHINEDNSSSNPNNTMTDELCKLTDMYNSGTLG